MKWKYIGINFICSLILFFLNGWFGNIQLNFKVRCVKHRTFC